MSENLPVETDDKLTKFYKALKIEDEGHDGWGATVIMAFLSAIPTAGSFLSTLVQGGLAQAQQKRVRELHRLLLVMLVDLNDRMIGLENNQTQQAFVEESYVEGVKAAARDRNEQKLNLYARYIAGSIGRSELLQPDEGELLKAIEALRGDHLVFLKILKSELDEHGDGASVSSITVRLEQQFGTIFKVKDLHFELRAMGLIRLEVIEDLHKKTDSYLKLEPEKQIDAFISEFASRPTESWFTDLGWKLFRLLEKQHSSTDKKA